MTRRSAAVAQLDLFSPASTVAVAEEKSPLEDEYAQARALAEQLDPLVHFGTSSWSFPGWKGLVYGRNASETVLARDGLAEYAKHPLLRTVGIDRGYYAPIPGKDLAKYASQLPEGFLCCAKAPERVTSLVVRSATGEPMRANPDFLSAALFTETVAGPFLENFRSHAGPILLELAPMPSSLRPSPEAFAEQLEGFLEALPKELSYAVELRDRSLLSASYRAVLVRQGVGHVYNYWTAMPMPLQQTSVVPVRDNPFVVVRLLLRPGTRYEARKKAFAPFDRLHEPDERMRGDVVSIVQEAIALRVPSYVLVNNKAEGSSPLTIRALAEQLAK